MNNLHGCRMTAREKCRADYSLHDVGDDLKVRQ
jgi:hypothetical protein